MLFKRGSRRDFFVKKWFQARIAGWYLLVLAAGGGALALVMYRRTLAALRACFYRGHVVECSSWELLRGEVVKTGLAATVIVVALAMAAVLAICWSVARASRAVRTNVRAAIAGQDPGAWPPPPRPHEFRRLQHKLAAGLAGHQGHVDEMRRACALLRDGIRGAHDDPEQGPAGLTPGKLRELHAGFADLKRRYRDFTAD